MKKYLLKRLIISIVALFCIVLVMFLLLNLMPGSPFQTEKLSPEQRALLLSKYGLDKSLPERFFIYLKNLLKGDFGVSYSLFGREQRQGCIQSVLLEEAQYHSGRDPAAADPAEHHRPLSDRPQI